MEGQRARRTKDHRLRSNGEVFGSRHWRTYHSAPANVPVATRDLPAWWREVVGRRTGRAASLHSTSFPPPRRLSARRLFVKFLSKSVDAPSQGSLPRKSGSMPSSCTEVSGHLSALRCRPTNRCALNACVTIERWSGHSPDSL